MHVWPSGGIEDPACLLLASHRRSFEATSAVLSRVALDTSSDAPDNVWLLNPSLGS